MAAADRLGVVSIIESARRHKAKLTVGTTLLLAPESCDPNPNGRRRLGTRTSLDRLLPGLKVETLTSSSSGIRSVAVDALRAIEDDLTRVVVEHMGIKLDTLFYDATNFFTYASTNARPTLPQRGRSKQKRADLRLFSLALPCLERGMKLCSHVYPIECAKSFPDSLTRIRERLETAGRRGRPPSSTSATLGSTSSWWTRPPPWSRWCPLTIPRCGPWRTTTRLREEIPACG